MINTNHEAEINRLKRALSEEVNKTIYYQELVLELQDKILNHYGIKYHPSLIVSRKEANKEIIKYQRRYQELFDKSEEEGLSSCLHVSFSKEISK